MIRTFRYRLYPTKHQEQVLNHQLAVCCELYNAALQERKEAWRLQRKPISYFDQTLQLTQIKPLRDDVAAINAQVLENVLKRVHLAFSGFFRRVKEGKKAGYPRFKSLNRYASITYRQRLKNVLIGSRVRLHAVGRVRLKLHRPLEGIVKTLTIKREAGRWFVKVDPRGTSQVCLCGAEVRKTLATRIHRCDSCGLVGDRDHISAQIILGRVAPSSANVAEVVACVA